MIKLNLVPAKVRAAETLRMIVILGGFVYALGGAGVDWQWGQAHAKLTAAEREVDAVQAELDAPDLQDAVKAVKKFTDDLASVKAKASVVNQFRKDQVTMVRILDAVPDWTMNHQVWFTNLEYKGEKTHHTVALVGNALSRALFARFYSFMDSQVLVKGLALDTVPADVQIRNTPCVQFKVTFSIEDFQ